MIFRLWPALLKPLVTDRPGDEIKPLWTPYKQISKGALQQGTGSADLNAAITSQKQPLAQHLEEARRINRILQEQIEVKARALAAQLFAGLCAVDAGRGRAGGNTRCIGGI